MTKVSWNKFLNFQSGFVLIMEDFCDGSAFKSHPIVSKDPLALQIIAYFDELVLCNPLGAHVKRHKLGIVFFTIGNILIPQV